MNTQFAVFDNRQGHDSHPYLFQNERTGQRKLAVYETEQEAAVACDKMNRSCQHGVFVVRAYAGRTSA